MFCEKVCPLDQFFSGDQKIVTGQPVKSGDLHNQETCVLSQSIFIIPVPLYSNVALNYMYNLNVLKKRNIKINGSTEGSQG